MPAALTVTPKSSTGYNVRKLRISRMLSQQQLADLAGVSRKQVALFEHNLPLPLDCKRRILKELWARKAEK
jgi:transcriptional regulator with XRE-family HTH domain